MFRDLGPLLDGDGRMGQRLREPARLNLARLDVLELEPCGDKGLAGDLLAESDNLGRVHRGPVDAAGDGPLALELDGSGHNFGEVSRGGESYFVVKAVYYKGVAVGKVELGREGHDVVGCAVGGGEVV